MSIVDELRLDDARVIAVAGAGGKTSLIDALGKAWADKGERVLATTTTKVAVDEFACGWQILEGKDFTGCESAPLVFAYLEQAPNGQKRLGFSPEDIDRIVASRRFDRILIEADGSRRCPLKAPGPHEPVIPASTDTLILVMGLSGLGQPLDDRTVFRPELWSSIAKTALGAPIGLEDLWKIATDVQGYGRVLPSISRRLLFLNQQQAPSDPEWTDELTRLASRQHHSFHALVIGSTTSMPWAKPLWFDNQTISP
jgi:probable selenium-dependent hydroxylase accessory protein YqeC